jgi:hypothetical protein
MRPAVFGNREWALKIVRGTSVAGWCYQSRQVGIDAPTGYKVEDVAREKPREYKNPEYDVANSSEAEVFEAFGKLFELVISRMDHMSCDFVGLTGRNTSITSISTRIRLATRVWW